MGNYNSHHVLLPKFTISDVAGITFGGFLADKYICSQPDARPDEGSPHVAHSGVAGAVPAISKPGVPVWDYITFPQAMIACCNRGKGWHLASCFEWAAMAFFTKKYATQPHGGNANVDPPSDSTYSSEIALLDAHLHGENGDYHRALPGTGPTTWAHNHHGTGIFDLQGLVWQWNLMFMTTDGYLRVPANLDVSYAGSPYGRGTISGSGTTAPILTCDGADVNWKKSWAEDAFSSMKVYIAESGTLYDIVSTTPWAASTAYNVGDVVKPTTPNGYRYKCTVAGTSDTAEPTWPTTIGATVTDNTATWECTVATATSIQLASLANPGDGTATFVIMDTIATNITSGHTSGNRILTLCDSDADLKPYAIPATSDATGATVYGNDGFWFSVDTERAAVRGGAFGSGSGTGVFALFLHNAPSNSGCYVGFRACKAL